MNIAWLILDSVSYSATSFADDGPDTTPELSRLSQQYDSAVFSRAYAPGIASPSSHSAFFTGRSPTATGMHEAYPRYIAEHPTIADALRTTHRSYLVSSNRFVFNGLERGFDEYANVLYPDPVFDKAAEYTDFARFADPRSDQYVSSRLRRYLRFALAGGNPVRSLINGLVFKMGERTDEFRYAERINKRIREFGLANDSNPRFIVANYMDAHAPFDPSKEAIDEFAPDVPTSNLPIKESGTELNADLRAGESGAEERAERMLTLYRASIWDLDRKIAPVIDDLLDREWAVFVTADHGNWFRRLHELEDRRLHVPLIIYQPGEDVSRNDCTVNISSLPKTTMALAGNDSVDFDGYDLRTVTEDQISITEGFFNPARGPSPVNIHGENSDEYIYQAALIKGDTKVVIVGDDVSVEHPGTNQSELLELAESLRGRDASAQRESIEYDGVTERRLEDLGYLG